MSRPEVEVIAPSPIAEDEIAYQLSLGFERAHQRYGIDEPQLLFEHEGVGVIASAAARDMVLAVIIATGPMRRGDNWLRLLGGREL